ncbi:hypothetical protein HK097_007614 [Rhizophlyctis rosea]|uniref:Uncharacterized protein n=1 Tax=Rhizophlyctis rosea TaxID=64517 RepID=A0AAD5SLF4_9FUNG|nr:hypothetical protein HK097_007614 [Rhizophlyctis rosea]
MTDPATLLDPINRLSSANANLRWLQLNGAVSPISDVDLTHIANALRNLELLQLANVWRVRGDLTQFTNLTELYLSLRSQPTADESLIVQLLRAFPHKGQIRGLGVAGARESKTWVLEPSLLLQFDNLRKFYIDASYWSEAICNTLPQLPYLQCLSLFLEQYKGSVIRELVHRCAKLTCLAISTETLFRIKLVQGRRKLASAPAIDRGLGDYADGWGLTGLGASGAMDAMDVTAGGASADDVEVAEHNDHAISDPSLHVANSSTSTTSGTSHLSIGSSMPVAVPGSSTNSPPPSQSPIGIGNGTDSSPSHGSGSPSGSGTQSSDASVDSGREVDWAQEAAGIVEGLREHRQVRVVFDGRSDRLFETLIRTRR